MQVLGSQDASQGLTHPQWAAEPAAAARVLEQLAEIQPRIPVAFEDLQLDTAGSGQLLQSLGKQQILVAGDAVDEPGLWPLFASLGQAFQPCDEGCDADAAGNPVVRMGFGWGQGEPPKGPSICARIPNCNRSPNCWV